MEGFPVPKNKPLSPRRRAAADYALIALGSLAVALGFNLLQLPNDIAAGGVAGISILVRHYTGWEPAVVQWSLNIPLFIAGWVLLGGRFGVKTAFGSLVLPLFVLLTKHWPPLTSNPLLAAVFGGVLVGAGLGIVFRGRGSTGGLDLAAQIVHKFTGLRLGAAVALLDGMVIAASGIVFSPEIAMYALIGLFVTSKTIDLIQVGWKQSKVAFIVSKETDKLARAILHEMDRGLTLLPGRGGYSGRERTVLMTVLSRREIPALKWIVRVNDPDAFVIISDTAEVLGEGFQKNS
jgi:uncharacterized membrane-anchored protein YitT (DUF2179 family)